MAQANITTIQEAMALGEQAGREKVRVCRFYTFTASLHVVVVTYHDHM